MSIILSPTLDCFNQLKTDYPGKVTMVQADGRDVKAFSSIKLGIVNLMPTKEATERQWSKLMIASPRWIEPVWIQMGSYHSRNSDQGYLQQHYVTSDELDLNLIEGIILTGAPVEQMAFEEVDYWEELDELIDRITTAHIPILAVCWGAQALLYKRYKVPKYPLGKKCFGIFEHDVKAGSPLQRFLSDKLYLPHSRHTGWKKEDLNKQSELEILIESKEAGVFALSDHHGDHYWSGHVEYEVDTLLGEYERDRARGLDIEPPKGYRQEGQNQWKADHLWEQSAKLLFSNWVEDIAPLINYPASY